MEAFLNFSENTFSRIPVNNKGTAPYPTHKASSYQNEILNKHSSFIHAEGEVSLLERKLLNILFKTAQKTRSNYLCAIALKDIREAIGWKSNKQYLFSKLESLFHKHFRLNILGRDKKHKWEEGNLFVNFYRKSGILYFQFKPQVMENCLNPNIYGKVDLSKQKQFRYKGSLVLYELFMEMVSKNKDLSRVSTSILPMFELKTLCGVSNYTYSYFKQRYLDVALIELQEKCPELNIGWEALRRNKTNTKSFKDLALNAQKEVFDNFSSTNSKIEAIRFSVSYREEYIKGLAREEVTPIPRDIMVNLSLADEKLRSGFIRVIRAKKMLESKVHLDEALSKSLKLYFEEKGKVNYSGKVSNPIGYFIKTFENLHQNESLLEKDLLEIPREIKEEVRKVSPELQESFFKAIRTYKMLEKRQLLELALKGTLSKHLSNNQSEQPLKNPIGYFISYFRNLESEISLPDKGAQAG